MLIISWVKIPRYAASWVKQLLPCEIYKFEGSFGHLQTVSVQECVCEPNRLQADWGALQVGRSYDHQEVRVNSREVSGFLG